MPRYLAQQEHWRLNGPPVYIAAAAYLGWDPSKVKAPKAPTPPGGGPAPPPRGVERVRAVDDLQGFMAAFGAAGGTVQ